METALQIIERQGRPSVNARELHAALGVGRDFPTWIAGRIDQYEFLSGRDFEVFPGSGENPSGGRPTKEYALSFHMAKELAMVENNDHGRAVRLYLIRVEEAWNSPDAVIARALILADQKNKALIARIEEDRPKVEAFERLQAAREDVTLTDAARTLQRKPIIFCRTLVADGVLFRGHGGVLEPYAYFRERGYFRVRLIEVDGHARLQTLVTPAGVQWLAGRYKALDRPPAPRRALGSGVAL